MSGFLPWLFGTRTGREVLVGLAVVLAVWFLWSQFADHYRQQGVEQCQADARKAQDDANEKQLKENADKEKAGSTLAKDTKDAADEAVQTADQDTRKGVEEVQNAYRNPPRTKPVAPESCVHPVDVVVQQSIDRAVSEANNAAR